MIVIKSLYIRNFRSIVKSECNLKDINVLVGKNDVGKSNYLKALNVFFNGETDPGVPFDFETDFSRTAKVGKNKARQIEIRLEVEPPPGFKVKTRIRWTKRWRELGLHDEERTYVDGTQFEPRSRIPFWLDQIRYRYVPAIKGSDFFERLLKDVYETLSVSVEKRIKQASKQFVGEIREITSQMSTNLYNRLGFESSLQMPQNLGAVFGALDFETDAYGVPMPVNNRGDGVKSRHIPGILYFLANEDNANKKQGSPRVHTIWGYEEPENNVELLAAFDLAKELYEYSDEVQIAVTTHSPALYNIARVDDIFPETDFDPTRITTLHTTRGEGGTQAVLADKDMERLDVDLGLLPLVTPHVRKLADRMKLLERRQQSLVDEFNVGASPVFVEGKTDQDILEAFLRAYSPIIGEHIDNRTVRISSDHNAGANWVSDSMKAWVYARRRDKAVALFDKDDAGKAAKADVLEDSKCSNASQHGRIKVLILTAPSHLHNVFHKGIAVPLAIEEMICPALWREFEKNSWLVERDSLNNLVGDLSPHETLAHRLESHGLSEDEMRYCLYRVSKAAKRDVARMILQSDQPKLLESLPGLKAIADQIIQFFGFDND